MPISCLCFDSLCENLIAPPLIGGNLFCKRKSVTELPASAHGSEKAEVHPQMLFQPFKGPSWSTEYNMFRIMLTCVGFRAHILFKCFIKTNKILTMSNKASCCDLSCFLSFPESAASSPHLNQWEVSYLYLAVPQLSSVSNVVLLHVR